jgi:hypothetical protein
MWEMVVDLLGDRNIGEQHELFYQRVGITHLVHFCGDAQVHTQSQLKQATLLTRRVVGMSYQYRLDRVSLRP